MRKITPYFDDAPKELWEDASKKRNISKKNNPLGYSKIDLALNQKRKHKFDRLVYGSKAVKDKLKIIFKCKCAYCETSTYPGAHPDVEHYRDKKRYYWLGYEWSNLLLVCHICNRDFKNNNFPIENEKKRLKTHPLSITGKFDKKACAIHLLNKEEQPLLLHPAIDDPRKHLDFLINGDVKPFEKSKKGANSIKFYGLGRANLLEARKKIVQETRKEIWEEYLVKGQLTETELITEIRKAINRLKNRIDGDEEYSGFAEIILENFDAFIIDNQDQNIDMPDKDVMRQIANIILNG
jgi:uncharacterized protein (TIGR02646 family)